MTYHNRILKHYLLLALDGAGVHIDGDTHAELDDALDSLDQHIREIAREVVRQERAKAGQLAADLRAMRDKELMQGATGAAT